MRNQYRLVGLGNSELLARLSELARQSNVLTAQLLAHLLELEQRMCCVNDSKPPKDPPAFLNGFDLLSC